MTDRLLTDEDVIIECCANCTQEDAWKDEDCKICQMNMRVAVKAQDAKTLKAVGELLERHSIPGGPGFHQLCFTDKEFEAFEKGEWPE